MLSKYIKIRLLLVYCVCLAFFKIYQANLITDALYTSQRLSGQITRLKNRRNNLLEHFFVNIQMAKLDKVAREKFHFVPLQPTQITTLLPEPKLEFIGSYSSDSLLLTLGLIDQAAQEQGGIYDSKGLSNQGVSHISAVCAPVSGSGG